jgi:hypothetical protein
LIHIKGHPAEAEKVKVTAGVRRMLAAIYEKELEIEARTILLSLGHLRNDSTATFNLLSYELNAAVDLGLEDQACHTLEALCFYVQDHPELRFKFKQVFFAFKASDMVEKRDEKKINVVANHLLYSYPALASSFTLCEQSIGLAESLN